MLEGNGAAHDKVDDGKRGAKDACETRAGTKEPRAPALELWVDIDDAEESQRAVSVYKVEMPAVRPCTHDEWDED